MATVYQVERECEICHRSIAAEPAVQRPAQSGPFGAKLEWAHQRCVRQDEVVMDKQAKKLRIENVARIIGAHADEAELIRWLMRHGDPDDLRAVCIERNNIGAGIFYLVVVNAGIFKDDPELWGALANAVVALSERA